MKLLVIIKESQLFTQNILKISSRSISTSTIVVNKKKLNDATYEAEQFRVITLMKKREPPKKRINIYEKFFKPPREKSMPVTQDWGNVWPGIRSFHPASVPLPLKMGYPMKSGEYPDKYANAELMKVPNFLHLTPPVIKRQCEALKKFCSPWPKELEKEDAQNYFFPMTVTTSTYIHAFPTIRDPRARVVSLSVNIDYLNMDSHAFDKLLRLIGQRFNPETRIVTLVADRCPLSIQNFDYCIYLLTVLYNESIKREPWEHEKEILDYEYFDFDTSKSKIALKELEESKGEPLNEEVVKRYKEVLTHIHNEGEDFNSLEDYKNTVLKLVNLN